MRYYRWNSVTYCKQTDARKRFKKNEEKNAVLQPLLPTRYYYLSTET